MQSPTSKAMFSGLVFIAFVVILCYTLFLRNSAKDGSFDNKNVKPMAREQSYKEESKTKYVNKTIVILYWSRVFGSTPRVNVNPNSWPFFYAGNNCPIQCEITTDKRRVHEAAALVVHARNPGEIPPDIYKNLSWILNTNENPNYTPLLKNPKLMRKFNYLASYRLDSDFPCPEFVKPSLEPPIPFEKKDGLIIVTFSNCELVRTKYISQLMEHIKVDSYGGCLRNKPGLAAKSEVASRHAVMELQRKYKFSIIFPNSDCDYYMTEKIYSALSAGSVPVWLGTDKIDEALKWGNLKNSIIQVKNFNTPKDLADYLNKLSKNKTEYNQFLKWKYEGFQFPKEYYETPIGQWWDGLPLYCRVCMRIAQDPHGHDGLPVDKCDGKQKRTLEKWIKNE